nr:ribonuclease H-like domain-containing protein [Tanacetum cinerariifolium]
MRPGMSYVIQQVCLYMHDMCEPHYAALKRIVHYIRGTIDHGLQLHVSSMTQLTAYIDVDWAGCPTTRRSILGYCVFLGDNLLSWSAKRHATLFRSSAEAEYYGVTNVVAETAWLCNLLRSCFKCSVAVPVCGYLHERASPCIVFEFRDNLNVRKPPVLTAREY